MYSRATEQQALNGKITDQVYHMSLPETNSLVDSRDQENIRFTNWLNSLTPAQTAYLNDPNNVNIYKIINDMKTNLSKNTTPAELAMKLFKESNIPFKEITQGNQVPTLTTQIRERGAKPFKSDTDNKKYQEYQDVYTNITSKLSQINTEVEALPDLISSTPTAQTQQVQQKLDDIGLRLNNLETTIKQKYDELNPIVKVGVLEENEKILNRIRGVRTNINEKLPKIGGAPPAPAPAPPAPPALTPVQIRKYKRVLEVYMGKKRPQYTSKIQEAIVRLFGGEAHNTIAALPFEKQKEYISRELRENYP